MIKIKNLRPADLPGVDEKKFKQWQDAHAKGIKQWSIPGYVLVFLFVFLAIAEIFLLMPPVMLLLILVGFLSYRKQSKLFKALGITKQDLRKARKGYYL